MNIRIERPASIGVTKRGYPKYDPASISAYRKARGATQGEVAGLLRCTQSLISTYERTDNPRFDLSEDVVLPMLDAIDRIAERHEKLVAEGFAELEAIRTARKAKR